MTALDWFDLFQDERRLAGQGWAVSPIGSIRNRRRQCPLCAWAELQGSAQWEVAWHLALRQVFGEGQSFGDAELIAFAADHPMSFLLQINPEAALIRGLLLATFNLEEPCRTL